jgi:hypothetical protein
MSGRGHLEDHSSMVRAFKGLVYIDVRKNSGGTLVHAKKLRVAEYMIQALTLCTRPVARASPTSVIAGRRGRMELAV